MQASPSQAGDAETAGAVEATEPLITGDAPYLWTGLGAVLFVAFLLIVLLLRWRASSKDRAASRGADFFQPAGEGAEITFDEDGPAPSAPREEEAEIALEEQASEPTARKTRTPFSGLFSKKERQPPEALSPEPEEVSPESAEDWPPAADIPADDEPMRWSEIESSSTDGEPRRQMNDMTDELDNSRADDFRRVADDERWSREEPAGREPVDEYGRGRSAHQEFEPRFADAGKGAAHDEIVRTLSEVEEALHVQREAIQAETRSLLDSFARRFSDRIDALAGSVERRLAHRPVETAPADRGGEIALIESISRRLEEHRDEVAEALNALARRIDSAPSPAAEIAAVRDEIARLRRSMSAAAAPSAPTVQLSDVVRNALAPDAYEFSTFLPNNRKADCLIRLARPYGPIAVDAGFPVEAFHALHDGGGEASQNEFRRVALRHIVDIAERLIVPGFTADSAFLFLPSETMAGELHARFPDVVQDAYRARVWIVSPTTLLATLHTLSAVMPGGSRADRARSESEDGRRALAEIERLSARLAAIEEGARGRGAVAPLRDASSQSADAERARRRLESMSADNDAEERAGDLYAEEPGREAGRTDADRQRAARPPFPLR